MGLLREFAMLILRFCPDEISKPSLCLFESSLVTTESSRDVSILYLYLFNIFLYFLLIINLNSNK